MKKIKWMIQDVNMNFSKLDEVAHALNVLGYEYHGFGVIPFTKTITGLENIVEEDCLYVLISGTKVLTLLDGITCLSEVNENVPSNLLEKSGQIITNIKNGLFYDVNKFDQTNYANLGLPLLNDSAMYLPIKDNLNRSFDKTMFIKPSRDLKAFDGGFIERGQTIKDFIENQMYQAFYIDEIAIISELRNISAEYRFFVVNGEITGQSMYKFGGHVTKAYPVPQNIIDAANEYKDLYQPDDIFTMDLADTDQGIKIIEYNCWNASGHYNCDLVKTYAKINNYMIEKYC